MNISEKVAYIKGLAEGLSVNDKVVNAILDVLGDIAKEVASLKEDAEYLDSYIEEIDEDLGALEEDYYGCDGDCDCCDEDCDCDCDCDCDEDDFIEVECPACGDTVCLDEDTDFNEVECPACGAKFSCVCDCCDEDDDDDCECGCCHHE